MLLIDNAAVAQVLTMEECIRVQEQAFKELLTGDSVYRSRIDVYVPCQQPDRYFRWGSMEGASRTLGVFAIRMKSDIVYWPSDGRGLWTEEKYCVRPGLYCGLIFLFSTHSGEPLAIINDGYLQHMRVGAGAGLGAKYLAREDAQVVGILGSGGMARTYLRAFACVRNIRRARVYSPTPAHREQYAAEMSRELGIEVEAVADPREAVRGADIVATCTDSMRPVLFGDWLEPGMHVTNLGPAELHDSVLERANVKFRQGLSGLVPSPDSVRDLPPFRVAGGKGHSPIAIIAGTEEEVARIPETPRGFFTANLPCFTDLVSGRVPGRQSRDDITLYVNTGYQGLQFAAVGWLVYEKARALGLGREVPTEWFLQDIRD